MKDDIATFNSLAPQQGDEYSIFRSDLTDGKFTVNRIQCKKSYRGPLPERMRDGDVVTIHRNGSTISACRPNKLHLRIEPRWNPESQECEFLVDEERCELWQVSQRILGDFMFDYWTL